VDEGARNLRRINSFKEIGFRRCLDEVMFPFNLTLAAKKKGRVPVFVFGRGM